MGRSDNPSLDRFIYSIIQCITMESKQMNVKEGMKLMAVKRKTSGYFYMVKNVKAQFGTSFIGNFDQLIAKHYSFMKGIETEEQLMGVLA